MKRLFVISILFLSVWITSTAYDFELDGLRYITINDSSVTVVHLPDTYNGWKVHYKGDIVIPKTVTYSGKTYTVTEIGHEAFFECYELTSITIPNTVTLIETRAFTGCSGLTSVKIPNSVTCIHDNAFKGCSRLASINIPNSVTDIGSGAFQDCSSMSSFIIPNSVKRIGLSVFNDCTLYMQSTSLPTTDASGYESRTVAKYCTIYVYPSVLKDFTLSTNRWKDVTNNIYPFTFSNELCGTMNKDYVVIKSPEKVKLSVILPSGYTQDDIVWSSDNSEIAEVDSNGTVTGGKPGVTVVHAKEEISNLDAKAVVVVDGVVLADSISLDKSVYSIHVGESASAKATVMPALTLNKDVRWACKDSTIVSIDSISGQFTGMDVGTTLIKATTNDGTKLCSKALVTVVDTEGYDFTKPATLTPSIEVPEEEDSYISFKEMNLEKEETSLTVGLGDRTGTSCRMYTDENLNYYLKAYAGATITIAGKEKNAITKVMFNGETIDLSANGTTLANGTWQGNAKSITFTVNSVNHINSVKVEYTPISNVTINDDFGDENGVTELKGDMNDDGNLDMSDVTTLISKVLDN